MSGVPVVTVTLRGAEGSLLWSQEVTAAGMSWHEVLPLGMEMNGVTEIAVLAHTEDRTVDMLCSEISQLRRELNTIREGMS